MNPAPWLVEFRCAELIKGRRCGSPVGHITPETVWRRSDPTDDGREATFVGIEWARLTLEVHVPTLLHHELERSQGRRAPDGTFACFQVEGPENGRRHPDLPGELVCVCARGRHRRLVLTPLIVSDALAEWRATRRRITRGLSAAT